MSVHGSTGSPRTGTGTAIDGTPTVRPEPVEGQRLAPILVSGTRRGGPRGRPGSSSPRMEFHWVRVRWYSRRLPSLAPVGAVLTSAPSFWSESGAERCVRCEAEPEDYEFEISDGSMSFNCFHSNPVQLDGGQQRAYFSCDDGTDVRFGEMTLSSTGVETLRWLDDSAP